MKLFKLNKEEIGVIIFIIITILGYSFFPVKNIFQQIIAVLFFFAILPLMFNKIILKKELNFCGIRIGNWRQGLIWSFYSLMIIGLIIFISSYYFGFLEKYTVPSSVINNFSNFLLYELGLVLFFVTIYEFYFRGFILSAFKSSFNYGAILIQTLLFFILILSIGGSSLYLFLPYLIFAPFAGFIAYKSNSIIYSGITQFVVILFLDVFTVKILS